MRRTAIHLALVLFIAAPASWAGGSCAYSEGLLALQQGLLKRAEHLLAIAAREGRVEAQAMLRRLREGRLALERGGDPQRADQRPG